MYKIAARTLAIFAMATCFKVVFGQIYVQPEQIHLSLGKDATTMVVTWVTRNSTFKSVVQYGVTMPLNSTATGAATLFVDGGKLRRAMFIHRTVINIAPGETYYYHVGSPFQAWSAIYYFTAPSTSTSFSPQIVLYGDLGNVNSRSLAFIQQEIQQGFYDAIIHVGDFAYDMDTNDAQVGDEFMRMIEAVAAYVPYMTCPGNHEQAYNFSNYVNRFSMPGGSNNSLFFSFNMGPAHFVAINTEFYYFGLQYGFASVNTQYNWLVNDLKEANKAENRAKRPWIISLGHRPMYCSNSEIDDCVNPNNYVRSGIPQQRLCGLEDLLLEFGVDFEIWGHMHSYERTWPMYNYTISNGTSKAGQAYVNPKAPVHLTTGSAGSSEGVSPFSATIPEWSAFRSKDYGYSVLSIVNKTHINLKQYSVDQDKVIDDFWIVKTQPYPSYYGQLRRLFLKTGQQQLPKSLSWTYSCVMLRGQ